MSTSDPWSCGSRRRRDDRGIVHRCPKDRARRRPREVLPMVGGVGVLVLQVTRPAPTARAQRRAKLDTAVKASFDDSGGTPHTYASPRVWEDLVEDGWKVSVNTVAESMARQGLIGRSPKRKRRSLTRPDKAVDPIPDLVRRDFSTGPVDQRWCGDLTEIPTGEGKLRLAIVLDLGSRRLPGFAMSEHHDSVVARAALLMAAAIGGRRRDRGDLSL